MKEKNENHVSTNALKLRSHQRVKKLSTLTQRVRRRQIGGFRAPADAGGYERVVFYCAHRFFKRLKYYLEFITQTFVNYLQGTATPAAIIS